MGDVGIRLVLAETFGLAKNRNRVVGKAMTRAHRLQIPVGFGGFHLSFLGAASFSRPYVVVYDCGAIQESDVRCWARRVGRWLSAMTVWSGAIDLLVLSHTDFDHVCGIRALLTETKVHTVVLSKARWECGIASLIVGGRRGVPGWYVDFIADPAKWLIESGVRRVILIGPSLSAEFEEVQDSADDRAQDGGGDELQLGPNAAPSQRQGILYSPSSETWRVGTRPDGWSITPVLALDKGVEAMHREVEGLTKGLSIQEFAEGLSSRTRISLRNQLAKVFRKHWRSTNRSSVIILVAPMVVGRGRGLLCTGDADLRCDVVLSELERHRTKMREVDAIVVPHHGSPHNIDLVTARRLMSLCRQPVTWVIPTGKNRWGYPSKSVEDICRATGRTIRVGSSLRCQDVVCF